MDAVPHTREEDMPTEETFPTAEEEGSSSTKADTRCLSHIPIHDLTLAESSAPRASHDGRQSPASSSTEPDSIHKRGVDTLVVLLDKLDLFIQRCKREYKTPIFDSLENTRTDSPCLNRYRKHFINLSLRLAKTRHAKGHIFEKRRRRFCSSRV